VHDEPELRTSILGHLDLDRADLGEHGVLGVCRYGSIRPFGSCW
jgi:hypothetical protein